MIAEDKAAAKCHWHSFLNAAGTCAVCGLAGCGTCLVQEAGGYRCQECIRERRPIVQPVPVQPQPPPTAPPPGTAPGQQTWTPVSPAPVQPLSPQPAHGRSLTKYAKVLVSLALFLVSAAIPIQMTNQQGQPVELALSQHLTVGYVLWALFWGAPAAWRLWRKFIFNKSMIFLGGCGPAGLAWMVTAPLLLVLGGWFYCLFGGGIYQFLKHLWTVSRTA